MSQVTFIILLVFNFLVSFLVEYFYQTEYKLFGIGIITAIFLALSLTKGLENLENAR